MTKKFIWYEVSMEAMDKMEMKGKHQNIPFSKIPSILQMLEKSFMHKIR